MSRMKNIQITLFFLCSTTVLFAQGVTVNDTYTAQQLVQNVLVNSPCANVSNFSVIGDNFSAGENSYGYFSSVPGSFPFSNGIILSTARARRAEGPNTDLIDEGSTAWTGDNDLEQALGINTTYNATILEFDFTPLTSKVSFDYIFASEEYHDNAQCQYSDGFAFLLKEAGSGSYQNLALIPNTNTPVLVTTVHPDIPGGCPAANAQYFGSYNGNTSAINYNGQTAVLTAKATVTPGTTYHIKLVIADDTNYRYDSAIFLGGGSFNVGVDLGPDQLIATNNPVCAGKTYPLDATEAAATSYKWYKNNALINGASGPLYTVSSAGVYKVEITFGTSTCIATGEVTIEYSPLPALANTTLVQCDEDHDGSTIFNLSKADDLIKNGDTTLGNVTYYPTLLAAQQQDQSQLIQDSQDFASSGGTVYASVSNAFGCANVASVSLQLSNHVMPHFVDFETCDLDGNLDGFYSFNLREIDAIVLAGQPSGLVVEYYATLDDALLQANELPDHWTNTTIYETLIYARIVNGPDCYGIIPTHLFVNNNSPDHFEDETVSLCEGTTIPLAVSPLFETYDWSDGSDSYQTSVSAPGEYTVTVSDSNTCLATKKFIVLLTQRPKIIDVDTNDFNEDGNSVLIKYSGSGDFEFSLDGIHYQDSPYFPNVTPGEYTAFARDKNGCGTDSVAITVLNYPKYFTPNGDGYNDLWSIKNLQFLPDTYINIFDRLGKLVFHGNAALKEWDGKLDSKNLPSEDYWFVIHIENRETIRGHFALKR